MNTNNQILNVLLVSAAAYSNVKKGNHHSKFCCNPKIKPRSPFRIESYDSYEGTYNNTTNNTSNNGSASANINTSPNNANPNSTVSNTAVNNMGAGNTTNSMNTGNMTSNMNTGNMTMQMPSEFTTDSDTMPSKSQLLTALYAADNAINMEPNTTGPFELPPLEYDYNALEPYIDEKTLRLHHQKHHKNYVDNLNAALARHPEFYNYTLDELLLFPDRLPSDIQTQVVNNGGGNYNHSLMWKVIGPADKSRPTGELADAINRQFGSFENLRRNLKSAAESVFGSGYAWLALNPYGRLIIITTSNQGTPIPLRMVPLLPIDVWEHAYYLKHQHKRGDYIDDYFSVINWDRVGDRYEAASRALMPTE